MAIITDRTLSTKPTGKDQWITENAPRGHGRFCLRITPAGERVFYFRYTGSERKQVMIPLGGYDPTGRSGLSLKEARSKAGELSRLYQSGISDIKDHLETEQRLKEAERAAAEAQHEAERIAAEHAAARLTVQGLFEKWATVQLAKRKDGGAEITRTFKKDVLPVLGSMYADEVRKGHIAEIVDTVLARGCNRLAKVILQHLRQMFGYAIYRDWLDADPTAKIRKADIGGKDVERDRVLSDDEIKLLASKMPDAGLLPTAEAAVWICLSICCRIGELLKARWEHVDFERKTWAIPAENSKNGIALEVALSDFALRQFQKIQTLNHSTPWLYPNRSKDGPVCVKTITKQLGDRQRGKKKTNGSKNVDALFLPSGKWTPHDLRRTGATIMTILGIAPVVVERCLNHIEQNKVKRIYQRYSYAPEMRHAWELLGDRLEALTKGQSVAKVLPLRSNAK
ncbi:MAG: integrase [Desulfuromonadaceae bacterium GWC2_58_13]|nr:MAG: integrase [Desulfuromonadaceae bacterium GWC2_58_13]